MKFTEAETDLHNAITSVVEAHTLDSSLAMRIADQVLTEGALNPTPALLRFLAGKFDADELQHIGLTLHTPYAVGAAYALRKIATDLEANRG